MRIIATLSYKMLKDGSMHAFTEHQLRYDSIFGTAYIPMLGIRSQLWNDYRNY
jgi:hypothetical protein